MLLLVMIDEIVINSTRVMNIRWLYPAGLHCLRGDAFVSSYVFFCMLYVVVYISER